jgi:hypothetical protein
MSLGGDRVGCGGDVSDVGLLARHLYDKAIAEGVIVLGTKVWCILMAIVAYAGLAAAAASALEDPLLLTLSGEPLPITVTASGGAAKLVTSAGEISGTSVTVTGSGDKEVGGSEIDTRSGTATLVVLGVKSGSASCKTAGAKNAGELVIPITVQLVDLLVAGVLTAAVAASLSSTITLNCGVGLSLEVKGAAIASVPGVENGVENLSTVKKAIRFKGASEKQEFETCDLPKAFCEGKTFKLEAAFTAGNFKPAVLTAEGEGSFGKMWTVDF